MSTKFLTLLALASTALAQGTAYITNDCAFPVYFQHSDQAGATSLIPVAAGASYSEPITTTPGARLMVWSSTDTTQADVEVDYTLTNTGDYQGLYYQLSTTADGPDDAPFFGQGYGIIPSNGGAAGWNCAWDFCSANETGCGNYQATYTCPVDSDLNLYVCSG